MSVYYHRTSAVASRFDPTRLFMTEQEARAYDHKHVALEIGATMRDEVAQALTGKGYERLRRFVDYLDDELPRDKGSV